MSILNNSIRCKVFMQILQLIQETESWMYRQGFQKTTVDLGYRPHWNRLRRLVGDEAEFSQCNLPESAGRCMGRTYFPQLLMKDQGQNQMHGGRSAPLWNLTAAVMSRGLPET